MDDSPSLMGGHFYMLSIDLITHGLQFLISATPVGPMRNKLIEMNITFKEFKAMVEKEIR
jgi:hypothetical protein